MALDLTVNLLGNTSNFKQGMDEAGKSAGTAANKINDSKQSLLDMTKKMLDASNSSGNFRRKLMDLTNKIADLTMNYRSMSDAEKNSDFGRALSEQIDVLTRRAGEMKDTMMDVRGAITKQSSDTFYWTAATESINIAKKGLESFISVTGMADVESEKFKKTMTTLAAVETTFSTVVAVINALQKESAIMQAVTTFQSKLATRAKVTETGATVGLTTAQAAFNAVANANPYVLILSTIAAVIGLIVTLTSVMDDSTESNEDNADSIESLVKKHKKLASTAELLRNKIGETTGSSIADFKALQAQFNKLTTTAEKTKWIEDNQTKFKNLGFAINDLSDAMSVFVQNSGAVIEALKAIAEAEAYEDTYKETIKNRIKWQNRSKSVASGDYYKVATKESDLTGEEKAKYGRATYNETTGKYKGMTYDYKSINDERAKAAKESIDAQQKIYDDEVNNAAQGYENALTKATEANNKLAQIGGKIDTKTDGNGKNNDKETKVLEIKPLVVGAEKSIAELEKIKAYYEDMFKNAKDPFSRQEAKNKVDAIENEIARLKDNKIEIKPVVTDDDAYWNKQLEIIDKNIHADYPKIKVGLDIDDVTDGMRNVADGIGALSDCTVGYIKNIHDMSEAWNDMDGWEKLISIIDTVINTLNSVAGVIDFVTSGIGVLNEILGIGKVAGEAAAATTTGEAVAIGDKAAAVGALTVAEQAHTAASIANTEAMSAAQLTSISAITAATLAQQSLTAALNTAAYAEIPFIGPGLAAAAMGTYTALWASAKIPVFAEGGIFKGTSRIGDQNLARLNDGEMILNQREQTHLFKMLENGVQQEGNDVSNVRFVLKGDELVGLMNNTYKKRSRV